MKNLLLSFTLLLSLSCFAQHDSLSGKPFDLIFGIDSLYAYGVKTVYINSCRLVYSREQCRITCINNDGSTRWTRKLDLMNCRLIAFDHYGWSNKDKFHRYDIILQSADKNIYGLRSRNGKVKKLENYKPATYPEKKRR